MNFLSGGRRIAGGAKANAHGKNGGTPVLSTYDDRVALLLLRAGADPDVRDGDGSLRRHAREREMLATLRWLDVHQVP